MSFMDSMQALLDKMKQRTMGEEDERQHTSNMANGGFSGYKPATAKHRTVKQQPVQEQPQQEQPAASFDMGAQQGYDYAGQTAWQQPQQQTAFQQTSWQQGYQQTGYQAWQQPQQTAWQQPQQQTAFQGNWGQEQQTWQQPQDQWGMNQSYQQQTGYYGNQPQMAAQDNISYMPGNFVGNDGRAYSHVERIAQVMQVAACYRVIEFMRNGESVIVNTELINDEMENQRCMDLLYGAAFAMNCTLTRISQKDIYLISPATVMVVPYDSIRRMSDQDMNSRWPDPEQVEQRGFGFGRGQYGENTFRERREMNRRSYTNRYDQGYGSYQTAYAR